MREGREIEALAENHGPNSARAGSSPSASPAAITAMAAVLVLLCGVPAPAAAVAPGWVWPTKLILDTLLLYFEFAFVARIVLSWYPSVRCLNQGTGGVREDSFCFL